MSKKGLRINGGIKVEHVRLIDESNNQAGIVALTTALSQAREAGLDLVEVSPTAEPPVCRIMDYGKYVYEQKRKARENRKKAQHHASTLKEIRLRPETDPHDLGIKLKKAHEFLEKGHKVQLTMFFRGRQVMHQDKGLEVLNHIAETMENISKVERSGRMTNRRMTMMLIPK